MTGGKERMGYADPVAQAEIDRLRAENESLMVAIRRLQELAWDAGWSAGWDDCWNFEKGTPTPRVNPYRSIDGGSFGGAS